MLAANVIISEIVATNNDLVFDEDGDTPDLIELYNSGPDDVNLNGWYLTDNAALLDKWSFPAVTLPAKNSMLVYASGKDRRDPTQPLHTSFQLTSAGEYLALAQDAAGGGQVVVSQFLPSYPQLPDNVSYGVVQTITSQTVVSPQSSLKYKIPTGQANETGWNQLGYNDGTWTTGTGGVGYQRAVPGFTVRDVRSSTTINNIAQATALLGGQGLVSEKTSITSVVNFIDSEGGGGVGNFASDLAFPNNSGADDNDFVIRATGTITIPASGTWTFGTNSDDGLQLKVGGVMVINDDSLHAPENRFGTISLTAGTYPLELVFFERGGGAEVELFAAAGSFAAFGSQFRLIGDVANGGLPVETPVLGTGVTAGFSGLIGANVESVMYNKSADIYVRVPFTVADPQSIDDLTLRVQYDDGFVAYLNGVEIARRNAPALTPAGTLALTDRAESQAQLQVNIDLSQYESLLQAGNNLLAIHAMNDAMASDEFLIRAELAELTVTNGALKFFPTPTPGTFNTTSTVDGYLLDEITLSHPHGFYSNSFNLAIAAETAGTTIRYTIDGSEPTDTNGIVYSTPVAINKTTTLRARAFKAGQAPSNVETATYIFLAEVLQQSPTGTAPAGWPVSTNINGQILNYGMDPDIVNNATWGPQMITALTQIPTMSLVMDVDDLLDPDTGIYTHANNRGQAWERAGSLELINPDGSTGFQSNTGVRIRGGYSRSGDNPKHAFRFFFRSEYGADKLNYPLFGDEGIDEFDGFDLRTTQNYSWSFGGDATNTFLRDVFARDVQREMEQPYTRSRYYHLYINGQYWGLYQTQERSEADYAASYFGGSPEDYDVVKSAGNAGGYQNEATDGNMDSYQRLANYFYQPGGLSDANSADFWKAQGKNPDGSRNTAYERLLDVENLMDYMISTYYQGDRDAPVTRFVPERVNNYFGVFNRENPDGFKFFDHDSEHTLDKGETNLVAQITSSGSDFVYFNPLWMHEQLAASNSQYRMMWADRVYSRLFNDGPLTPENARALLESRAAEINMAIIAESARWGDSKREPALTKTDWQNAVNTVLSFVSNRNAVLLSQLRAQGWYPSIDPPQFAVNGSPQHGGDVGNNSQLTLFSEGMVVNSVLLPAGSTWKYIDNGVDQGTAWRQTGFADGSWKSGPAELGYGDGDETTTVLYGPDGNNKYITTYFRKSFNVTGLANYQQITLRLKRDDGAIVYLNGKEVVRSNMPADPISYSTLASSSVEDNNFFDFVINKSDLVEGTNLLAVEVHQSSGGSSDISFDLELLGGVFQAPAGTAYYTLDGSDPMLSNGTVSPNALVYSQPINLNQPVTVNARLRQNNNWSALNSARFVTPTVPPSSANLKITEINYNPHNALTQFGDLNVDNDEFEYVEVTNVSSSYVDLTGVRFAETNVAGDLQGMTFTFAPQTLGPNQRLVVVSNRLAFQSRYGTSVVIAAGDDGLQGPAGEFGGQLSNSGETVRLVDAFGATIQQIAYDDNANWPGRADGNGSSLQIVDANADPNLFSNWRNSVEYGGSPGATGVDAAPTVAINEVLAHTDLPQLDSIELVNTTNATINMSRWYVSDSNTNYFKYQFAANTQLAAGAYRVLNENDFNPGGGLNPNDFSLSSTGDDVWLLSADPTTGRPLRFVDRVTFDATFNGVSIGRLPNGTGDDLLVPLAQTSLGQANTAHRVNSVVISEIQYNPSVAQGTQQEFVEIYNRTDNPVDISNWQLRGGVDFDLPNATILPAHQAAVIVSFDPLNAAAATAFRTAYGISNSVPLFGPWEIGDALDNGGENLLLKQPDTPPAGETQIPYVLVDVATYDDDLPWPAAADGLGSSLNRKNPADFGRPETSWVASVPTPGLYLESVPAIDLQVLTNGFEAPNLLTGSQVNWTYQVANVGNVTLTNLQVTDNKGVLPTFASFVNGDSDNQFEPGEVWLYQASGVAAAGNYSNIGTATASYTDNLNQQHTASDTDGSSYFGAGPSLDLTVLTNGSDGPNILTGNNVTWSYQVTNTGNVTLTGLQVTDNKGVVPTFASVVTGDGDSQFEPGEVWLYQASGLAAAGSYANTGTANASYTDSLGAQRSASDTDGSSYFGAGPSLDLTVLTNGSDGPNILTGNNVTWNYQVTNTGNVTLTGLQVTDNKGVVPSFASVVTGDGDSSFEPGEVWLYQASGLAAAGSYANTGTATASYTDSLGAQRSASDTDGSSYFGAGPTLDLTVLTNGSDGPNILTGNNVTWTYQVTNTGNVTLTGLQVTDNKGVVPSFASVVTGDGDSQFEPGEVWLYQASGLAAAGSYSNTGTATASYTDSLGAQRSASDTDGSSYFGAGPSLDLTVLTNGSDGPNILTGNNVTWTYQVTNTGNVTLTGLQVTDNKSVVPSFASVVAGDGDSQFEPGEVWLYQASGLAAAGSYANTGTATASFTDSLGAQRSASDTDGSSYFGAGPALDLTVLTNGSDGSNILTGSPVTWTYQVTNTGNVTLNGLLVTDNKGVVPSFASVVTGDGDSQFEPGEVWLYQANGLAAAGSYSNTGTATASYTDSLGAQRSASDTDGSSYFGGSAAMDLVVLTSGSDGPSILVGNNVTWTYQVTNVGNVTLTGLQVTDSKGVVPTFASVVTGDADSQFEPGEVWLYQASGLAAAGSYANTGTATASYTDSQSQQQSASDTDGSSYFGANPNLDIAVSANGGDGLSVAVGNQVTWDYQVANSGNVTLSQLVIGDSSGKVPVFKQVVTGDADGQFEPGEVWLYGATSVAVAGVQNTTGTANASYTDTLLQTRQVTDSDGTSYVGVIQTPGDIDNDGAVTVDDLDALTRAIWQQTTKPEWDLNGDSKVDLLDRAFMVDNLLQLTPGDINDDVDVDSDDLLNFLAGWTGVQAPGEGTAGWRDGDWDGDMDVDSKDLLELLANWTGNLGAMAQPTKKSPFGML
ncbi:MAG: lamin tail domain-containing protein [Pirellulales bacterium]